MLWRDAMTALWCMINGLCAAKPSGGLSGGARFGVTVCTTVLDQLFQAHFGKWVLREAVSLTMDDGKLVPTLFHRACKTLRSFALCRPTILRATWPLTRGRALGGATSFDAADNSGKIAKISALAA